VVGPVSTVEQGLDRIAAEAGSLDAAVLNVNLGHLMPLSNQPIQARGIYAVP
jgi:hypothetical protein